MVDCANFTPPTSPGSGPTQSILNPDYIEPVGYNKPGFSILIYLDNVPYQFNAFYSPPSMEIEENRGFERGSCTFRITDDNPYFFNLPFIPVVNLKVEVWNLTENDLFFEGRIAEVDPALIVRRCNGTEVTYYDITCTDLTIDFERVIINEVYEERPVGFIAKDLISRYTFFDASGIDPTSGAMVTEIKFSRQNVAACLQRLLQLEPTWTFWYDLVNRLVYFGEITTISNTVLNITEANVYEIFDPPTFKLAPDNSIIKNRVYYSYNQRYNKGTVSVSTGDEIVLGQGTEFLAYVSEGAQIRVDGGNAANGSDAVYGVRKVLSDTEISLDGPYQEVVATEKKYEIIGSEALVVVEDANSIAQMAQFNNETGPYAGVYEVEVPNDGNPYTRAEALQIARAHLLRYVQPLISGEANSDNSRIPLRSLHAGQVINFNLPTSRRIIADVVIQKLVKKDTGALLPRIDIDPLEDRVDPYMTYSFDFKDRIFDINNVIKRLQIDVRRATQRDNTVVQNALIFSETINIYDCIQIEDAISYDEEIEITDQMDLYEPDPGPYYTQPTARLAGWTMGYNPHYGFAS